MAATKRSTKKTAASKKSARDRAARNASGPVDAYFAEQPADKRALLEKLSAQVRKGVADAESMIKWGVPFYQLNGRNLCALAAFKDHVGINFFAPPDALADPGKKLEGSGKGNRMLMVRTAADIDGASIQR
jgi:hypothetical protein